MKSRHPDLMDWCRTNKSVLRNLRKERYALEKGFVEYAKDIKQFVKDYREGKKKRKDIQEGKVEAPVLTPAEEEMNRNMYQQAASLDLLRKMKWERIKWTPDADYEAFARRINDHDVLFKNIPAFSFLKLDITKDPSSFASAKNRDFGSVSAGDVSSWACTERSYLKNGRFRTPPLSKSPFSVDWVTGKVTFLDSITANEIQTFLKTLAPQAMALQVALDDEQKKITADLETLRLRLGALRIQFNGGDNVSYWQDPRRISDAQYVDPNHLRSFIDGMLRGATFYRYYLSGNEIKIVHPTVPFSIDMNAKLISIPANFADSNWVSFHSKAAAFERMANACRRFWYLWFAFAVMLFGGDLDIY